MTPAHEREAVGGPSRERPPRVPSPGAHALAARGHRGASEHPPAHEDGPAAFSFIKSRPTGRQLG